MINWIPNYISSLPLHLQLVNIILSELDNDDNGKVVTVPPVKMLSNKFSVSSDVVRSAYQVLKSRGVAVVYKAGE